MIAGRSTEREAREFIAENEPLLPDARQSTLGHIIVQGSEIATRLSDEIVAEMDERTKAANELEAAIRDPKTKPKRLHVLETRHSALEGGARKSTKDETFDRLSGVLERAIALAKPAERAEPVVADASRGESGKGLNRARPWWKRLFG